MEVRDNAPCLPLAVSSIVPWSCVLKDVGDAAIVPYVHRVAFPVLICRRDYNRSLPGGAVGRWSGSSNMRHVMRNKNG